MKFFAEINVMPLKALLDPQGKAVTSVMHNIGFKNVANVQVGKHLTLEIEAETEIDARQKVDEACKTILTNPIIEFYDFVLKKL